VLQSCDTQPGVHNVTAVTENKYCTFFQISKKMTFYFFEMTYQKVVNVINIFKQQAFETKNLDGL